MQAPEKYLLRAFLEHSNEHTHTHTISVLFQDEKLSQEKLRLFLASYEWGWTFNGGLGRVCITVEPLYNPEEVLAFVNQLSSTVLLKHAGKE